MQIKVRLFYGRLEGTLDPAANDGRHQWIGAGAIDADACLSSLWARRQSKLIGLPHLGQTFGWESSVVIGPAPASMTNIVPANAAIQAHSSARQHTFPTVAPAPGLKELGPRPVEMPGRLIPRPAPCPNAVVLPAFPGLRQLKAGSLAPS